MLEKNGENEQDGSETPLTLKTETTDYEGGGPADEDTGGHDAAIVDRCSNVLFIANQTALLLPVGVDSEELQERDVHRERSRFAS